MDVSIVTVNYRSANHVRNMIASALENLHDLRFEIVVVNNDVQESLSDLSDDHVRIIEVGENIGFAAGCNKGMALSKGRYVALINPDVVFVDGSMKTMIEHLDADADVGIAGARLLNTDGSVQASVRRFPQPFDQLLVYLKVPHVLPHLAVLERYIGTVVDYTKTQDVDQVMGAYFVIRREVIEKIGVLDEGFFYWFEEVDYCVRARQAGWKVRYYSDVKATHIGGGSFARVATLSKQRVMRKSLRRYMRKHFGWKAWALFTILDPLFWITALGAHVWNRLHKTYD